MKRSFSRVFLTAAVLMSLIVSVATPTLAQAQFHSNQDIWRVRHRLEATIVFLQHNRRDYGGHRVVAITDIQAARNELLAAEKFEHHLPIMEGDSAPADEPGVRSQMSSDRNLQYVHRNLERSIDQLQRDAHDYGGHRIAAINDLRSARTELVEAERFARSHGH